MIVEQVEAYLKDKQRRGYKPSGNYASQAGHPCERHLVYQRLNYDQKLLPDVGKLLVFRDGNVHEEAVIRLLQESGFQVVEQQRPFEWKKLQLTGRIDASLKLNGTLWPTEIKSVNRYDFERINSIEDMIHSPKAWVQAWPAQIMLYLLMAEQERGLLLFKNKQTGALKEIIVTLDYGYAEQIVKKLERVNQHIAAGTYPERITERTVCQYCDFRHLCLPDEMSEVMQLNDDAELLDLLEQRDALKQTAKDYEEIDEKLKAIWKRTQVGTYLVGSKFQVKVSTYDTTIYPVPAEIKEPYKETKTITKAIITTLQ